MSARNEDEDGSSKQPRQVATSDTPDPTRRAAVFWLAAVGTAVTGAATFATGLTTVTKGVLDITDHLDEDEIERARRTKYVRDAFFSGLRGEVPMVPGFDQSIWKQPSQISPDDDIAAIRSLLGLFDRSTDYSIVEPGDALLGPSGIVCTGSPTTNHLSRLSLDFTWVGDHAVLLHSQEGSYSLPFIHRTGTRSSTLRRILSNTLIEEPNNEIVDVENSRVLASIVTRRQKAPVNGYLLFSKVPHPKYEGHSVAIWAGNIGPATEAACLIFSDNSLIDLSTIEEIREFASNNRFFQALFIAEDIVFDHQAGRNRALSVRLAPNGLRAIRRMA